MRDHRTARWPRHVAPYGTAEHEHQRRVVLELATEPPPAGDDPAHLAEALGLPLAAVEEAADALIRAGLAERRRGRLFPSAATSALDALWPIGL